MVPVPRPVVFGKVPLHNTPRVVQKNLKHFLTIWCLGIFKNFKPQILSGCIEEIKFGERAR